MAVTGKMTFAEAAAYQDDFLAVAGGKGTYAQAATVDAVVNAVSQWMRDIGAAAGVKMDQAVNALAAIPDDKRDAVIALLGEDMNPRLVVSREADGSARIGSPEDFAKAARAVDAAAVGTGAKL